MLLHTTIEKRRSRAFKRYKVYQNRTIIKEVRSKNVILLPVSSLGSGPCVQPGILTLCPAWGPDPVSSPGPDPGASASRKLEVRTWGQIHHRRTRGQIHRGWIHRGWIHWVWIHWVWIHQGRTRGRIHQGWIHQGWIRGQTCPTPGSGPVQPPGPDPSASASRKITFLLITSLIMVRF